MTRVLTAAAWVCPALCAAGLISSPARADFFFHHWEDQQVFAGRLHLTPSVMVYSSTENFENSGATNSLGANTNYGRFQSDVQLRYGVTPDWTVFGRLSLARAAVQDPTLGGESFGLGDQTLGVTWKALSTSSGMALSLQAQIDLPAYSNSANEKAGAPDLGDGSVDITGGAFLQVPLGGGDNASWTLTGGAGYTFRTNSFSQAVPWSVAIQYDPSQAGIRLGVAVLGMFSLQTDPTDLALSGKAGNHTSLAAGGSFAVNAVNPSLTTLRGRLGYRFSDRFSFMGGAEIAMAGNNAPSGTTVEVAAQFSWGPRPGHARTTDLTPDQYGHSNSGFVNYSFEGHVSRVNDRLNMFKVDKGHVQGVEVGQTLDVFAVGKDGIIGEAIARAKVTSVKSDESVLKVIEYYKEKWIEEGFIVKRPLSGDEK